MCLFREPDDEGAIRIKKRRPESIQRVAQNMMNRK